MTDGSAQSFCAPPFFPNCLVHLSRVKEATITGSVQIGSIFLRKDCFVSRTKANEKKRDGRRTEYLIHLLILFLTHENPVVSLRCGLVLHVDEATDKKKSQEEKLIE